MSLEAAILAALLDLPGVDGPTAELVAPAIAKASGGNRTVSALLIVQGYQESKFLPRIMAGQCRGPFRDRLGRFQPAECDGFLDRSGRLRFRSRSAWQLQAGAAASLEEWRATTGTAPENVTTAATVAARVLRRGLARCHTVEGAIALYATGSSCRWSGAGRRAALARRIEVRISGGL